MTYVVVHLKSLKRQIFRNGGSRRKAIHDRIFSKVRFQFICSSIDISLNWKVLSYLQETYQLHPMPRSLAILVAAEDVRPRLRDLPKYTLMMGCQKTQTAEPPPLFVATTLVFSLAHRHKDSQVFVTPLQRRLSLAERPWIWPRISCFKRSLLHVIVSWLSRKSTMGVVDALAQSSKKSRLTQGSFRTVNPCLKAEH